MSEPAPWWVEVLPWSPLAALGIGACLHDGVLLLWLAVFAGMGLLCLRWPARVLPGLAVLVFSSPPLLGFVVGAAQASVDRSSGALTDWRRGQDPLGFHGLDEVGRYFARPTASCLVSISEGLFLLGRDPGFAFSARLQTALLGPPDGAYLGELPSDDLLKEALLSRPGVARIETGTILLPEGEPVPLLLDQETFPEDLSVLSACGPMLADGRCDEGGWVALATFVPLRSVLVLERSTGRPLREVIFEDHAEDAFGRWLMRAEMAAAAGLPFPARPDL